MEGLRVLELVERPFLFEPALRPFEGPQGPQAQGPCFLEIQVSLALLDALDAALQLVQELRIDVLEVVLDALPALGCDFRSGIVHQILAQSEDGIRRAVALDEARHTEFHEVLARATQAVAGGAETRDEVVVEELVDDVAQRAVVTNLELLAVQVLVLLLVAVLLFFLVVVFVVANLQVGAAVDCEMPYSMALARKAASSRAVRIMPV